MAGGAARAASGGEGTDAAQRRAGAAAPGVAVGPDRQGVPIRDRGGSASLADLFRGARSCSSTTSCSGPTTRPDVPSCSAIADGFDGFVVHLANHDVTLSAVSRAPLAKLQAYKQRMGWTFPWASSLGGDFNFDFNVSFTEEQQREGLSNTTTGASRRRRRAAATGPRYPRARHPKGPRKAPP